MKLFKVVYVKDTKDDWYLTSGDDNMTADDIIKREIKEKWNEEELHHISVTEINEIEGCKVKLFPKKNNYTGYKKIDDWEGCTVTKIGGIKEDDYGNYLSDRYSYDIHLVSNKFDVITVEDYNKWYNLFYITSDNNGEPMLVSFTFGDIIDGVDHYYYPDSVVKFAKVNNLKIDAVSYIAICKMYMEDTCGLDEIINDEHLPSRNDLDEVIVNGSGICGTFYLHHFYDAMTYVKYAKQE